jgi:hypothetical protein
MSDFLPDGYERQESVGNYMSLEEGANPIRVLSSAVVGWEWWTADQEGNRTPNRVRNQADVPWEFVRTADKKDKAKEFWAFVVYNQNAKTVQILEIKQQTIMRLLEGLVKSPKWGNPRDYDIVIFKSKTGPNPYDVEYSVMPEPKEPIDPAIVQTYENMGIRLEALYEGADPFEAAETKQESKDATVSVERLNMKPEKPAEPEQAEGNPAPASASDPTNAPVAPGDVPF